MPDQIVKLMDWSGGLVVRHVNPLNLPPNCLSAGENVDITDGTLRTRDGISATAVIPSGALGTSLLITFENDPVGVIADGTHIHDDSGNGATIVVRTAGIPASSISVTTPAVGLRSFVGAGTSESGFWFDLSDTIYFDFADPTMDFTVSCYVKKTIQPEGETFKLINIQTGGGQWLATLVFGIGEDPDTLHLASEAGDTWDIQCDLTIPLNTWWKIQVERISGVFGLRADSLATWTTGTLRATGNAEILVDPGTSPSIFRVMELVGTCSGVYLDQLEIKRSDAPGGIGFAPVVALEQVRFPTNETAYVLAEMQRVNGARGLYVSKDHLPTSAATFEKIYDLGADAGVISVAVLNDRAVITEGVTQPPLVFPGCLEDDGSDWAYPKAVLASQDGTYFYDVTQYVCDKDLETVADLGNIRSWGWLAVCTDMPLVSGFYFEMGQPNSGAGEQHLFIQDVTFVTTSDFTRQDLKDSALFWVQDASTTGHFEGATSVLTGAAADNLDGTVTLTTTAPHGFTTGSKIGIHGTVFYNGALVCAAGTTGSSIVLTHTYNAETFAPTSSARKRLSLGAGNDCPDVEVGLQVVLSGGSNTIKSITGDGCETNDVELVATQLDDTVTAMYGMDVTVNGVGPHFNHEELTTTLQTGVTLFGATSWGDTSIRQIIPAEVLTTSCGYIQVTLLSATDAYSWGFTLRHCSIVERSGETANGTTTPTPITFEAGQSGVVVGKSASVVSDLIEFTLDETKDYLLILDIQSDTRSFQSQSYSGYPVIMQLPGGFFQPRAVPSSHAGFYYQAGVLGSWDQAEVDGFTDRSENQFVYGLGQIDGVPTGYAPASLQVCTTSDVTQFAIMGLEGIQSVAATEVITGASKIYYAVSLDQRATFQVWSIDDEAWRTIVKEDGGTTWQYQDDTDTWQNATTNTLLGALRQAFAESHNQMASADLLAITPEQWTGDGGITVHVTPTMDFALGMQIDGQDRPAVTELTITYADTGTTIVEGFKDGQWTTGEGWTDNTQISETPWAQDGSILYNGTAPFQADYHVLDEVPGYWFRFKTNGTAPGTSIARITYKAPCQPLASIGDGQPDTCMSFVYVDTSANLTRDFTSEMSDNILNEQSKADIPMATDDYLYCGYVTRFNEIEITPYEKNNIATATLTVEYWNGEGWTPLNVVDGTLSSTGATLSGKGRISWAMPTDWHSNIPLPSSFPRGFWVRLSVSAPLTTTAALSEVRVYPVPSDIKKHRLTAAFQNRIVLLDRPDARDQVDISREMEEYGWTGASSGAYRIGALDTITGAIAAWDGFFVAKAGSWHQLVGTSSANYTWQGIEATRQIPANNRVTVKAPMQGGDGDRSGLFFINEFGAYESSGLQVDSVWNTARGQTLSEKLNWWLTSVTPRIDTDHLSSTACGIYWPSRNWVVWSVPMIVSGNGPQTTNNRLIVYDLTRQAWLPPFAISLASLMTAYHYNETAPGKRGTIGCYGGDYQGRIVRLFDQTVTDDLGTAINGTVDTGWLTFDAPDWEKLIRNVWIYGKTATSSITLSVLKDGAAAADAGDVFTLTGMSSLGTAVFGMDFAQRNMNARSFKLRLSFSGPTSIYGILLATENLRQCPTT
jgi:hypothetical protein